MTLSMGTIVIADTSLTAGEQVQVAFSNFPGDVAADYELGLIQAENGTLEYAFTWGPTVFVFVPNEGVEDSTNIITYNSPSGTVVSNNYAIDTAPPTATITVSPTTFSTYRPFELTNVTITFSEAVSGFTLDNLTAENGSFTNLTGASGRTYYALFSPASNVVDDTNVITLDLTGITDAAGNSGTGTATSNNYAVETVVPTLTSVTLSDNDLGAGETAIITVEFSEAVTSGPRYDFEIDTSYSISNFSSADGGETWTATITPSSNVTKTTQASLMVQTSDSAGNQLRTSLSTPSFSIDTKGPTWTVSLSDTDLRPGETAGVTITFTEAVTGFTKEDITFPNGTLSEVTSADGGVTWQGTFTPDANHYSRFNTVSLDSGGVADLHGNPARNGDFFDIFGDYKIDTRLPTATVTLSDTNLKAGETSQVTITFSDMVQGFDLDDLTLENGTLSIPGLEFIDFGVSTLTGTFTPFEDITDSENVISLNLAGVQLYRSNFGTGTATSANYAIDTKRPELLSISIYDSPSSDIFDGVLSEGETATLEFTFSEAVTGLTASDISVTLGALTDVSSADGGITWTATYTPPGNISGSVTIRAGESFDVEDLAGNSAAAPAGSLRADSWIFNRVVEGTVSEDASVGHFIDRVTSDLETAPQFTLGWALGGPDAELLSIDQDGNVSVKGPLDFETHGTLEFTADRVGMIDSVPVVLIDRITFAIGVTDVNEAPAAIALSANSVSENAARGTVVGVVSASDPDAGDQVTFTLADDAGGRFSLNGTSIVVADRLGLDYEQAASHTITVRATDTGGKFQEQTLTINVGDVAPETVMGDARGNTIMSGDGIDVLNGGAGDDILNGGAGRDVLTGGDDDDTLYGAGGDDRLTGGAGRDMLDGGAGDDGYWIDSGDRIVETAASGDADHVHSDTMNLDLRVLGGGFIESAQLTGAASLNLTGNAARNILLGNDGANTIAGGAAGDILTGNGGADRFVFNARLASSEADRITDFTRGEDRIVLDNAVFTRVGADGGLRAAAFVSGTVAKDADDRILYDAKTGTLFYDADGSGEAAAVKFALLATKPALSAADILIV